MQPTPTLYPSSSSSNPNDFFFWWSVISTIIAIATTIGGVVLMCIAIKQATHAESEKNRKKDQVKIWMQHADGLSQGLKRIIQDNLDKRYSSTQDITNAVWAIEANAFALRQSLYEERCVTEPEYKQQQKEFIEEFKKNYKAATQTNTQASPATTQKKLDQPKPPTTNQS